MFCWAFVRLSIFYIKDRCVPVWTAALCIACRGWWTSWRGPEHLWSPRPPAWSHRWAQSLAPPWHTVCREMNNKHERRLAVVDNVILDYECSDDYSPCNSHNLLTLHQIWRLYTTRKPTQAKNHHPSQLVWHTVTMAFLSHRFWTSSSEEKLLASATGTFSKHLRKEDGSWGLSCNWCDWSGSIQSFTDLSPHLEASFLSRTSVRIRVSRS